MILKRQMTRWAGRSLILDGGGGGRVCYYGSRWRWYETKQEVGQDGIMLLRELTALVTTTGSPGPRRGAHVGEEVGDDGREVNKGAAHLVMPFPLHAHH